MKMKLCSVPVMRMILWCYILCCISLLLNPCHGIIEGAEKLKFFEDFEIEQKLKLINKPAVKIIKSIYGERYGCVDFYKQPGFDHPSMKNHTFHHKMRLMSYPKGSNIQRDTLSNKTFGHLWKNGVGCPIGTVPILRITKNDILRMKSFGDNDSNPRSSWNNTYKPNSNEGHHFAVVRTTKGKPKSYNGASMNVGIYTPYFVGPYQFSSARLHFQIGNEYIQFGWIVHQQLYRDFKTRFFVFTNAGGISCYNNLCPSGSGMILVNQDYAPGILIKQNDITITIMKDQINGSWWLLIGPSMKEIGFWPSSMFKESSGTGVEWGGEAYSSSPPSPPMGNCHFPVGNPKKDSYIRLIATVDENYKTDTTVKNVERFSDNTHCYKVTDSTQSFWKPVGHLILYGGPGCK